MTTIAFYHINKSSFENVLITLLQKSFNTGKRTLVLVDSEERASFLDNLLWSYDPSSWLPHGTCDDAASGEHPILLTSTDLNINSAEFLFLLYGTTSSNIENFERCFNLFDGRAEAAVQAARGYWSEYKKAGHILTYWQQDEEGSWKNKS
ncbi:MAG: hypothetical protein CFH06_01956 [Alphaproteobacteria bacterium MarineAlpha3_Bin5]|nr:DNA polymerase III subunit chi [Magnetovibrio sp.]PPR75434.1 MAG: hypothetical protein CFH06_01956 [Alphaproteobacteria bacterium MarineAlpha3_Bin5]|tara:strand:+ start:453 stop:902 length:450 start_codon:yes stop_codon:yes gene_type:complete